MESESSEVDSDRTVPAEDPSSDEDYDDSGSDYPEGHQSRYYPFQRSYTCRPISGNSREHLEQGNLVILPESALEFLNDSKERVSHCGVVEFTAEEGTMMVPGWMMENLKVEAGETLLLKSTTLEKGTFAKLQPHSVAFLATRDVKAVLEQTLIDIVETKPDDAICIIDTDCTVEFAVPLDYKEPAPAPAPQELREEGVGGSRGFIPFTGAARRLNETEEAADEEMQSVGAEPQRVQARPVATAAKPENKQFQPFSGRKYTLGG
ncbi:unnamed protein product [Linum tenue]|uniref:Ubiquitin fusion degradation protein UFD1 N-terminal subdomain 1 domain-containing protein n=1 Tax=Linum tenue TaxID=586396 RepID=A0AAV0J9U9_9ROSI|nr:unnamed protein product [Linum tenue]